jgi:hypothetical protein
MRKHEREVRRIAIEYGLHVERRGSHFGLIRADGLLVGIAPSSPSDHRGMKNLAAVLRQATPATAGRR